MRRLIVWCLTALAWAYPLTLAAVAAALAFASERYWMVTVVAFLPRAPFVLPLLPLVGALLLVRPLPRGLLALQGLSLALWLFPIMGLHLAWPKGPAPGAKTLRVLSFNIDSGNEGVDDVLGVVADANADLVLFQEVGGRGSEIAKALRDRYPTVDLDDQFLLATRGRLLSKGTLTPIPFGDRIRTQRFREYSIDTELGRLTVLNVHPISPRESFNELREGGLKRQILSGGIFSAHNAKPVEAARDLRLLQLSVAAARANAAEGPVLIAGDTNSPGGSPIVRNALGDYEEGFSAAGNGLGYTFPEEKKHWPWMRIDRMFVSKPLRFTAFEVSKRAASDHRAIVGDVTLE